jgi:hypothetical protein
MLKPADMTLAGAAGTGIGVATLLVCLGFETAPAVTAVLPVGIGVSVRQMVLAVLKRRAWKRANRGA